jgi:hypothetical protein
MAERTLPGHAGGMPADHAGGRPGDAAEVSSLTSIATELRQRVEAVAGHYLGSPREDVLGALLEVERLLRAAERGLAEAGRLLRQP